MRWRIRAHAAVLPEIASSSASDPVGVDIADPAASMTYLYPNAYHPGCLYGVDLGCQSGAPAISTV